VIAEGEVRQLAAAKNMNTTEDEYLYVVSAKTASLFAASAEVGPVLAERPQPERAAFKSYGANLGLVFQLIDDVLDYGGNSHDLGKAVGDDFRDGKITLPLVLAYRRGSDEDRAFWQRVVERNDIDDGDLERAIALLHKHRALDDTVARARHFGAVARDALAPFPRSPLKAALLEVVDFCIERAH
jgi:octaprenyl-diphosphate synthase